MREQPAADFLRRPFDGGQIGGGEIVGRNGLGHVNPTAFAGSLAPNGVGERLILAAERYLEQGRSRFIGRLADPRPRWGSARALARGMTHARARRHGDRAYYM